MKPAIARLCALCALIVPSFASAQSYSQPVSDLLVAWSNVSPLRQAPAGECFFDADQPGYFASGFFYEGQQYCAVEMVQIITLQDTCTANKYVMSRYVPAASWEEACDGAAVEALTEWLNTYGED